LTINYPNSKSIVKIELEFDTPVNKEEFSVIETTSSILSEKWYNKNKKVVFKVRGDPTRLGTTKISTPLKPVNMNIGKSYILIGQEYPSPTRSVSSVLFIVLAIAFMIVAISIIFGGKNIRVNSHLKKDIKQKEEANKRIINLQNFIKVNLRRGYRQEHIKHVLSRRGFSTDELDRVFRRLNK